MTYNVFGGTLNLAQLNLIKPCPHRRLRQSRMRRRPHRAFDKAACGFRLRGQPCGFVACGFAASSCVSKALDLFAVCKREQTGISKVNPTNPQRLIQCQCTCSVSTTPVRLCAKGRSTPTKGPRPLKGTGTKRTSNARKQLPTNKRSKNFDKRPNRRQRNRS